MVSHQAGYDLKLESLQQHTHVDPISCEGFIEPALWYAGFSSRLRQIDWQSPANQLN